MPQSARIDQLRFGDMDMSSAVSSVIAPRVPGGKVFLHKVEAGHGPAAAAAAGSLDRQMSASAVAKGVAAGRMPSVSTAVTRAIGDWDGSRALVPHPEFLRFSVPPNGCMRAVLASDGLWDFVSTAEAARLLCSERTAQACADRLIELAVNRSKRRFNDLKDDVTVVVVELNPSGAPPPLTRARGGGCCALS